MNKNKSQLTDYLKPPTNLILIVNDGVSKGRSLASSVVASVPSAALRTLRALRSMETTLYWPPLTRLLARHRIISASS